ncbi:GNAT family N-acetyltransferase [Roseisalinus antarcticus]|uniref:Acetyltransferase (GNAT) family protein n=1 Tax=Roseisalinus antarcticus TaxID=254357 RepID=A0A1Y5RP46_9RHOB|nr:GNAT family N-acetyltransferase [Roseisalinus antarcticus]SLN19276.1 Acetyltransferase (GNAT) family protein [Roseisalinus antarcticus]
MTAIRLCSPEDAGSVLPLVARFHEEYGLDTTEEHREMALTPLLEGSPLGAVWIFGPARAPVGYMVVTFSWSLAMGGMDAYLDEIYIRPSVRGRGIASEALHAVGKALREGNVRALHLEVDRSAPATQRLFEKAGFRLRDRFGLMGMTL